MTLTDKTKAELEALIAEAQAALDAKEAADPLLVEAREICARVCEGWRDIPSERSHAYRDGCHDDEADVAYALAALRRGMELASAPAEPVDDAWIERTARECAERTMNKNGWNADDLPVTQGALELSAMLAIRAALAHRGARWPGEEPKIADRVRGLDYAKPDWMGDRCTTETTCADHGRCMPIFGQNCGAKGDAA
jgi:hypothetical protein